MKNRLIYGLIGLMLTSLIGIISIQTSWINDAITERERQFDVHVNDALNAVNESIDKDEAATFLEHKFGGMDSLFNERTTILRDGKNTQIQVEVHSNSDREEDRKEEIIISRNGPRMEQRSFEIRRLDTVMTGREKVSHQRRIWRKNLDDQLNVLDSTMIAEDLGPKRIRNIESIVERYSFETLLTGKLSDRISPNQLQKKLKSALQKEGIHTPFAYAVRNTKTGKEESGFVSKGFESKRTKNAFTKPLFPNDRRSSMAYELVLQPEVNGTFVWSKVWKMTLLSVLFTLLILLSFGYSIYFIFKQKKLSQIKNDFINNMTHELKTPLASISLATASIRHPEIINNPKEVDRLTQIIESEKNRMNGHVERVLDTAALDSGELHLKRELLSIQSIIAHAQKNIELSLLNAGGTIELHIAEDVSVLGDSFHLTNAITNILDNSIKYKSSVEPRIIITAFAKDSWCEIQIQDNGIGMRPKELKYAFDTFYRAESGDVHTQKGFGLGLSYVKSVVEHHEGKVKLSSEIGKGTKVNLQLPTREE